MIFDQAKRTSVKPVWVALAVAVFGVLAMLVVDHGPWAHPHAQPAQLAYHETTAQAARAAGATVEPTAPKPAIEPDLPVPKQIEPPNPQPD